MSDIISSDVNILEDDINILEKEIANPKETPYLDWIKSGMKTFEGRLKTKIEEWNLYAGKKIRFYDKENPNSWVVVEVISLSTFKDFGEAYFRLGFSLIPKLSQREVVNLYNTIYPGPISIDGITTDTILKTGVVAIEVRVLYSN